MTRAVIVDRPSPGEPATAAASLPAALELYAEAQPSAIPYVVPVVHAFDEAQRAELTDLLDVDANPYRESARHS